MTLIAVDSSGHVKNPPVIFVGTKEPNQQDDFALYVSEEAHDDYVGRLQGLDYFERLSASLIFVTVFPLYERGDNIVIDSDFQGKTGLSVKYYLSRFFGAWFQGKRILNNPDIVISSERKDEHVKCAHIKCTRARHKDLQINRRDPGLERIIEFARKIP